MGIRTIAAGRLGDTDGRRGRGDDWLHGFVAVVHRSLTVGVPALRCCNRYHNWQQQTSPQQGAEEEPSEKTANDDHGCNFAARPLPGKVYGRESGLRASRPRGTPG